MYFFFILLIVPRNGLSQENIITLEYVIQEAKGNHPLIKALRQRYLGLLQNITAAGTMDYPMVGVESSAGPTNLFVASQNIPFPGKLSLRGKIAGKEADIALSALNSKILEVVSEVKKAYWRYWLAGINMEIYQDNITLLKRVAEMAESLYGDGKVPYSDVLKVNIEIGKMEVLAVLAEQERISAQTALGVLLDRGTDVPLGSPTRPEKDHLNYSLDDLNEIAEKNSQELKEKKYLYELSENVFALVKYGWAPDFSFGVKLGDNYRAFSANLILSVYFWKQKAIMKKAKYEREAAELEFRAVRRAFYKDLSDLYMQYLTNEKFNFIYETNVIPLTKRTLSLTKDGYQTGKNTMLELLDSQNKHLSYSVEYYFRVVQRENAIADLKKMSGVEPMATPLPPRGQ